MTVDRVGLSSAHARDVSFYGGAVTASALEFGFRLADLSAGRVERIEIDGLRTAIAVDGGKLSIGGRTLPTAAASPDAGAIDSLILRNAEVRVTAPTLSAPARLTGNATLIGATLEFDGLVALGDLEVAAKGHHDLRAESGTADILARPMSFRRDGIQPKDLVSALAALPTIDGRASAAGALRWNGSAVVPDLIVRLEELAFETRGATVSGLTGAIRLIQFWPPMTPPGQALTASVALAGLPASAVSLRFQLIGKPAIADGTAPGFVGADVAFDLTATAKGPHGSVLEVAAAGQHDIDAGSGKADVVVKTMKFHRNSKQPKDLFPALGAMLPPLDGQAGAKGTVRWKGSTIVPDLLVRLDGIAFETSNAKVSAGGGEIRVTGFVPPATPPHQVVTASIAPGGLPASALVLKFQVLAKPAIIVEALSMEFAGGKVAASPFTVDPGRPAIDTKLHFSAVDLERAFQLLDIDGVGGTGRLDGEVGLHVRDGKLRIDESRLVAPGPGVLHISNPWLIKQLGTGHETVRQALQALGDFRYDALAIELIQAKSGDGSITLRLQGHNPAILEGRRFNFNIRLESNFDRLTEIALRSVTAAHQLLRTKER
jgi:hypothetical protein